MKSKQIRSSVNLCCMLLITALLCSSCGLIIINDRDGETSESVTSESLPVETEIGVTMPEPSQTSVPGTPVETPDYEAQAKGYSDALPKRDFGGIGITIATVDDTDFMPTDIEAPTTAAKLLRNRAVEEKYNTIIMTVKNADIKSMLKELQTAQKAGVYYADLLAIPSNQVGAFASAGALMNMNTLPFTDYTQPYYNSDAMKQMSAGYYTYAAAGSFTEDINYLGCIYFNRNLLESAVADNLYLLADSGVWTWDVMLASAKAASAGVDGMYGFATMSDANGIIDMMFTSSGQHYMTTGVGKIPARSFNTTRSANVIIKARELLYSDMSVGMVNDAAAVFYNGGSVFLYAGLNTLDSLKNMPDSWGILPIPKTMETQVAYYTSCDSAIPVIAVPSDSADIENIGLVLQALNAASYKQINDRYYTHYINDILRDNDSINMLDLITKNFRYDFAYIFGGAYSSIPNSTYELVRSAVKNNYAIDRYYDSYTSGVERQMSKAFEMY